MRFADYCLLFLFTVHLFIKDFSTESFSLALLSCHHQCSATGLVYSVYRCIMGKEQLDAVHMTCKCCSVKRSPAEEAMKMKRDDAVRTMRGFALGPYLPLASLQPAMSDPIASSSSDAHGS